MPFNQRLRKFVSYYKPYRVLFWADIAAAVTVSAVSLVMPLCVRHITGTALSVPGAAAAAGIFRTAALMLALVILQSACAVFYDHMGHVMGARMERDMRDELFAKYQSLSFSFFDREKTGKIISRITHDLLSIAELAHHGPEDIIIYFLTFAGALMILFRINGPLALMIAGALPLMFVYSYFYAKKLGAVFRENRERIGELNARIEDSISGIRTVKSFCGEGLETERFIKTNGDFYRSRAAIYKHEARYYTAIGTFFTQMVIVLTVVFGGMKLSGQSLSPEDLISFLLYAGYLTAPLPTLARITAQYQEGISGFNRFMEVMELPGEEGRTGGGTGAGAGARLPAVRGDIEFSRVSFKYPGAGAPVFRDLSFSVKAGEYLALTGPSGIGKTTLCSLIPRFYECCSGRVLLDGRDIREIDLRFLREHIGVVQQEVYIFAGTIRENIAYGKPGAGEAEIIAAAEKAHAHGFISALPEAYDTVVGPRGLTLSGGQRQRLCIARVFLKDPPILIFDEATSALDYESERVVQESLGSLSRSRTSFVIAHRLSTIKAAGRVLVLDGQGIS
jgi:ATP-binding cassette subfamily B protein